VRILHVIQELRTGGAERIVVSLVRGAEAAGHEVAVASAPGALLEELDGRHFPLPLLRRRVWRVPGAAWTLRQALRAWRSDLVHCHNPGMALVTSAATGRGRRPPAIASVHGVPIEDWSATVRVLRVAGLPVVACGPNVEAALSGRQVRVLDTIWNGVAAAPPPADREALELEWRIPAGHRLIVAVGRLFPQKNHALAVRALAALPAATLAILGEGPLRSELEQEAAAAGVADRVVLAGVRTDAREIMGAADAVVMPSVWEGLSLTALEALAAGTPFVAADVPGLGDLVTHERDGLLVPGGDADTLAAALRRVLDDPELAARLGSGGKRLAAAHTEERMVEQFLELYARQSGS
jgi:glycosyltransferase involved in cell wall biosynthesis